MKLALAILLLLTCLVGVTALTAIPIINNHVTDNAGVLSASAKSNLESKLQSLEQSTNGVQFVVYIEDNYPKDYSLEEYALKLAEDNKIGEKGNDNGVLLYVAVDDGVYRWEIGYGAEATLNTPLIGRISRQYIAPNFINGAYEAGIVSAVDVVSRVLTDSKDADIVQLKSGGSITNTHILWIILILFIISVVLIKYWAFRRYRGSCYNNQIYIGAAGGLFAGGFGRGGGFSGGGGRFGGGGFSGRW